jgi:hypothetical protein
LGLSLRDQLDMLAAAFTRGSLDVPAGLLTAGTAFSLNGRPYESFLIGPGGSSRTIDDPLVRLLARGAGGYRAVAKALQYALQQPVVELESVSDADADGARSGTIRLRGLLRDSQEAFDCRCSLTLSCQGNQLTAVDVSCSDRDIALIARARSA